MWEQERKAQENLKDMTTTNYLQEWINIHNTSRKAVDKQTIPEQQPIHTHTNIADISVKVSPRKRQKRQHVVQVDYPIFSNRNNRSQSTPLLPPINKHITISPQDIKQKQRLYDKWESIPQESTPPMTQPKKLKDSKEKHNNKESKLMAGSSLDRYVQDRQKLIHIIEARYTKRRLQKMEMQDRGGKQQMGLRLPGSNLKSLPVSFRNINKQWHMSLKPRVIACQQKVFVVKKPQDNSKKLSLGSLKNMLSDQGQGIFYLP